jgi:tetratricopeptide (TPR) repeat protein
MTLQRIRLGQVILAVFGIFIVSLGLSLLTSCLMLPFMSQEMLDRFSDLLQTFSDTDLNQQNQLDRLQAELSAFTDDYQDELTLQYAVQWTLVALVTYAVATRVARRAESPAQAVGYGVLIGGGVLLTYGAFCVAMTVAFGVVKLIYLALFVSAGYLGGRAAGGRLHPQQPLPSATPVTAGYEFTAPTKGGIRPEIHYNMGVQAALGGRRDEARQHFTRALQANPRYVPAWLQLANLADSPLDAWQYIQQARAISPNDPAVQQAVAIVWPQVASAAQFTEPPRNQPPYPGGQQDDVTIPRSTLPPAAPDAFAPNGPAPGSQPPDDSLPTA